MSELTLPLALFNLLPVLFTGFALWFLARLVGDLDPAHRTMARAGGVLILLGGLSKAVWKLILVASGQDLTWLASALFPLMAPGFALLAGAALGVLLRVRGRGEGMWIRYGVVAVILVVVGAVVVRTLGMGIPRGWFLPLLGLASVANLMLSLSLIASALRLGRKDAALFFGVNLAMVFALPPIAMASPDTLYMHWLEQVLTAIGTAAFALGAYRLWRSAHASATLDLNRGR
ncbi:MAG: hypothetical protein KFB96_00165 [Thiocapsa sp.]|uniref:hypothetical protein n=1 Tax=Thiocapsa sp. TaxID=2024551 RepID=UPI001BD1A166|nr:hypothetical protein [Thiocapsa sp.]QVL49000.1 MAG: hypothetical protein KFB96_00165 [Thiocapsa sp.]